jgi:hypothetical protein
MGIGWAAQPTSIARTLAGPTGHDTEKERIVEPDAPGLCSPARLALRPLMFFPFIVVLMKLYVRYVFSDASRAAWFAARAAFWD